MGWLLYRKPQLSQASAFEMIQKIMDTASECQKNNTPMSFACGVTLENGNNMEFFTVWVGLGDDNPIKRNQQLIKEIDMLKRITSQ